MADRISQEVLESAKIFTTVNTRLSQETLEAIKAFTTVNVRLTQEVLEVVKGSVTLTATCPVIAVGVIGKLYTATMMVTGGVGPYTWSLNSGPAWLSINASTGVVSGTPPSSGVFSYSVHVLDSNANTANITCGVTIGLPCPGGFVPGRGGNRFGG